MRISFSTGTFYHRSLAYSLRLAREVGYDGVEWVVTPGYLLNGLEPVRRAFDEAGVRALSIHPPFYRFPGWPRRVSRRMARLGALARHLGADLFVVHTPATRSLASVRLRQYEEALDLGQLAGGPRVGIGVETSQYVQRNGRSRRQRFPLDDLATLVAFCQRRGCGITLDTCHVGANGEDLLAAYAVVKPLLRNIHLSDVLWRDGRPVTHRLPGTGALPLARFLSELARDGYDGLITIEMHPRAAGLLGHRQAARRMAQALEFVRTYTAAPATASPDAAVEDAGPVAGLERGGAPGV
jgi:sugar phosphate isomerase/epimerase